MYSNAEMYYVTDHLDTKTMEVRAFLPPLFNNNKNSSQWVLKSVYLEALH